TAPGSEPPKLGAATRSKSGNRTLNLRLAWCLLSWAQKPECTGMLKNGILMQRC
ncbi:hypothetical protein A2U01_0117102, partial [Trifolium medium]|nr:hypothetical protein [Trifolium medium]